MRLINLHDEFIAPETRPYLVKIGRTVASGLSGFIFGFLTATLVVIFILAAYVIRRNLS